MGFFPKGLVHGFGQKCKMWPCFYFSQNKPKKNVFENILETKKAFQEYKNEKLKNWKIGIFSKGLVYGFGQEGECFSFFFVLVKIRHVSVFDNILDRKKPFKTIKTESKKKKKVDKLGFF